MSETIIVWTLIGVAAVAALIAAYAVYRIFRKMDDHPKRNKELWNREMAKLNEEQPDSIRQINYNI